MTSEQEDRWQIIRGIWKAYPWLYGFAGFILGLVAFPFVQWVLNDFSNFVQNFIPEIISIVFTVFFIDRLYQQREEQQRIRELKERLVRQAGSPDNATALNAIREMRANGWIVGQASLLRGAHLLSANLINANLFDADLSGALLSGVDLSGATLSRAMMKGTKLRSANLRDLNLQQVNLDHALMTSADLSGAKLYMATLREANLRTAVLAGANLKNAVLSHAALNDADLSGAMLMDTDFSYADLRGTNLSGARTEGANFFRVKVDRKTTLPDGNPCGRDVDWMQFGAVCIETTPPQSEK